MDDGGIDGYPTIADSHCGGVGIEIYAHFTAREFLQSAFFG